MATTKTIQAIVKNRTDTAANWTQKNPVIAEGEIIVVQTSAGETRLKIGDGVKTFTQLPYTDEQIYNNVVTSVNGQTGDITTNSVEYTPQTLTDEQKKQARENIGSWEAFDGATKIECNYTNAMTQKPATGYLYATNGEFTRPESLTADELVAWNGLLTVIFNLVPTAASAFKIQVENIGTLISAGVFGDDFMNTAGNSFNAYNSAIRDNFYFSVLVSNVADSLITVNFSAQGASCTYYYYVVRKEFYSNGSFSIPIKLLGRDGNAISANQFEMYSNPTTDMQIATKKYVDDKITDKELILSSSTEGSTKKFKLTIDDTGTLTASEITA